MILADFLDQKLEFVENLPSNPLPKRLLNATVHVSWDRHSREPRKEDSCMHARCTLPFWLWSHLLLQCSSGPTFFRSLVDGGLAGQVACCTATQQWQGEEYVSYLCLFQSLPASVHMLTRRMAAVELPHALSHMAGSPAQNSGKRKTCCK